MFPGDDSLCLEWYHVVPKQRPCQSDWKRSLTKTESQRVVDRASHNPIDAPSAVQYHSLEFHIQQSHGTLTTHSRFAHLPSLYSNYY